MKISHVKHKGLRRLLETGNASSLPTQFVDKICKVLAFLQDMEQPDELRAIPSWKVHQLSGNRKGTWSIFISRNWRITFRIHQNKIEIINLDYEDYH